MIDKSSKVILIELEKINKNKLTNIEKILLSNDYNEFRNTNDKIIRSIVRDMDNLASEMRDISFDIERREGIRQSENIYYKEEGKREGIREGEKKALTRTAIKMIEAGATDSFISKTTDLSMEEIKKLKNKYGRRWFDTLN